MIAYAGGVYEPLLFLVYALACARLTGMFAKDEIFAAPRRMLVEAFVRRSGPDSLAAYLLVCQWCLSIWLSIPVALAWWLCPWSPWTLVPAAGLAMSQLTGMFSSMGR